MKVTELKNAPGWLKRALVENENVEIDCYGTVIWHGGVWRGGDWHGGDWHGGDWHGGVWHGGVWRGGDWRGREDRLLYMTSMLGIVFDSVSGIATAYRSTKADYTGRYTPGFTQPRGIYEEANLPKVGSGTCVRGIHVTSAKVAWTYFGVDPTAQLWKVTFSREQLLDCDGEKARISGGFFEPIPWPFYRQ